jgi:preprotein translocase subunit YajC
MSLFISPAYAQAAASAPAPNLLLQLLPLLLIFVIFYFLLIRPQQRRMKQHREMIDNLKRGDTVVTGGGFIGKVTRVQDDEIEVEIAANTRVRVVRGTITDLRAKGDAPANDGADKDKK